MIDLHKNKLVPYVFIKTNSIEELEKQINEKCYEGYIASVLIINPEEYIRYLQIMILNVEERDLGHKCTIKCLEDASEYYDKCKVQHDQIELAIEQMPKDQQAMMQITLTSMKNGLEAQSKYLEEIQNNIV